MIIVTALILCKVIFMKNRIGGACWYIVGSRVKSKPIELVFAVSPSRTQLYRLTKGKDGLGLNQENVE